MRNIKVLILVLLTASLLASFYTPPEDKDKVLLEMVRTVLKYNHYQPRKLDDTFSRELYDQYLEQLDHFKLYFTQQDLDTLRAYRDQLDDQIKDDDLLFFETSIRLFRRELKRTHEFAQEILAEPFDLNRVETLETDYDSRPPVRDQVQLRERWRKRLKQGVVSYISERQQAQAEAQKTDTAHQVKPLAVLEKEGRKKILKRYNNLYKTLYEKRDAYWMSLFLNTFAARFDPHTNYLAPREKRAFDLSLSGQFEGIGARLETKDGYISVAEIIPGSPSYRQGDLEAGDKILKVAQGDTEPVGIVGMNLEDAIKLIKGKKGTTVKLTVKKVNGTTRVIPIVRDVVQLRETFAKSAVIERGGEKYGLIRLPSFYFDINGYNGRNSADDVKKELEALKAEHVRGIVLDLRNNGGGSLRAAVKMAGLFLTRGPIVQVKAKSHKAVVLSDPDPTVVYGGPLVVLVNEYSASASEILAAALQDYKRGVIAGSKHTFGKGTVQGFLDLDHYTVKRLNAMKPFGYLKVTSSKFYRINGGATQLKGVIPDIQMPTRFTYLKVGEKEQEDALPWDQIKPLHYKTWGNPIRLKAIERRSVKRMAKNPFFTLADKDAKWLKSLKDTQHSVQLNLKAYKRSVDSLKAEAEAFDALSQYDNKLRFTSPGYERAAIKTDTLLGSSRKAWHKNLRKDAYIGEGVNILSDLGQALGKNSLTRNR